MGWQQSEVLGHCINEGSIRKEIEKMAGDWEGLLIGGGRKKLMKRGDE